jgi:hypothetical protein
MKVLVAITVIFAAYAAAPAIDTPPITPATLVNKKVPSAPQQSRRVKGQELVSANLPKVRIKFDKPFKYVGQQNFVLYDVANAEQHFFVDTDKEGRIKRLYWIQFEGYLPSNSHTYRYKSNKTVDIAGLTFVADASALNIKATTSRPDSDGSRAQSFLQSKGYRLANDEILMQRLVHLTDETKRSELMIIYMEDLSGLGVTAAELGKGGAAADRWPQISAELLDRALKGMKIRR